MVQVFDKVKNLYSLKRKADSLKKRMSGISVEVEEKGVKIIMRGDQQVEEIVVDGEKSERLRKVFNRAVKEAQKKVAKKMQGELSDLGIPGL